MKKIYLNDGPRDGDVETIEEENTLLRVGIVWNFRREPASTRLGPVHVDQYRINQGPDDGGHYAAVYVGTDVY